MDAHEVAVREAERRKAGYAVAGLGANGRLKAPVAVRLGLVYRFRSISDLRPRFDKPGPRLFKLRHHTLFDMGLDSRYIWLNCEEGLGR